MLITLQVAVCDRRCGETVSFRETSQPFHRLHSLGWTTPLEDVNELTVCPDCSRKGPSGA